jgi:hypothetical protein
VIHISAVTLAQTTRNAPNVVRKIYRPMDPIRLRVPDRGETNTCRQQPTCAFRAPISGRSEIEYAEPPPASRSYGKPSPL